MKTIILAAILAALVTTSHAATILSGKANLKPAEIDQIINLVDKSENGTQKKVQLIVTDRGMSTDVSPRYTVYLGYANLSEMGNIFVNFKINDEVMEFKSAKRKSAGIYEIKVTEYREGGMFEVTQTIDATKMFSDELKARVQCGDDFCDQELKSSVSIKETAKKLEF